MPSSFSLQKLSLQGTKFRSFYVRLRRQLRVMYPTFPLETIFGNLNQKMR
jgi:hypothetical protein